MLRAAWYVLATPNPAPRGVAREAITWPLASNALRAASAAHIGQVPHEVVLEGVAVRDRGAKQLVRLAPITEMQSELWMLENVDR